MAKIPAHMQAVLDEVERALPSMTWQVMSGPPEAAEHKAKFYAGQGGGWNLTVTSFDIAPQGFPPGSRGYDGAAGKGTTVLHLTRELAEKAFAAAEKWCFLAGISPA